MPLCGACPFVGYCVVFLNTVNVLTQKNTTERARGGGGCSLTGEGESPGAGFDHPRGVTTPALPPGWPTPAKACFLGGKYKKSGIRMNLPNNVLAKKWWARGCHVRQKEPAASAEKSGKRLPTSLFSPILLTSLAVSSYSLSPFF